MVFEFGAWELLNIAARLGVVTIVIIKLTWLHEMYRLSERLGLGIAGGAALMTIPVLLQGPGSPFSDWASAAFTFGVFIYFCGRLARTLEHYRANRAQRRLAAQRQRAK